MTEQGIVVDANIMSIFIQEEIQENGETQFLINELSDSYGLAITDIIEREWKNTAGNEFFNFWFDEALKNEKIRYIEEKIKIKNAEKKIFEQKYGFPLKNSRDIHFIQCSLNTENKYIYTDDIDFYEPKLKKSDHKTKEKIKTQRSGSFCKFLNKNYGIIIGRTEHCLCDLNIAKN